jgi:hypothetical protein
MLTAKLSLTFGHAIGGVAGAYEGARQHDRLDRGSGAED